MPLSSSHVTPKVARRPSQWLTTSRPRKRPSCSRARGIVTAKDLLPGVIAQPVGLLGRAHDVGEGHGRQHPLRFWKGTRLPQKLRGPRSG